MVFSACNNDIFFMVITVTSKMEGKKCRKFSVVLYGPLMHLSFTAATIILKRSIPSYS